MTSNKKIPLKEDSYTIRAASESRLSIKKRIPLSQEEADNVKDKRTITVEQSAEGLLFSQYVKLGDKWWKHIFAIGKNAFEQREVDKDGGVSVTERKIFSQHDHEDIEEIIDTISKNYNVGNGAFLEIKVKDVLNKCTNNLMVEFIRSPTRNNKAHALISKVLSDPSENSMPIKRLIDETISARIAQCVKKCYKKGE